MTFKEKLIKLAELKAELQNIQEHIETIQSDILEDKDFEYNNYEYDLDGIKVTRQQGATYKFIWNEEQFEKEHAQYVKKSYVTTWLTEEEKTKYFSKKLSKACVKFEWLWQSWEKYTSE